MKRLKDKALCKLVKDDVLEALPERYAELVRAPAFLCLKCGRVARDEDRLCKPVPLADLEEPE